MNQPFITFGSPDIQQDEIDAVIATMQSCWLGTGPKVAQLEKDFSRYKLVTSEQVAAVNSCTAALHVSLIAAGVGPGDEVITTPLTFCATVNAIIHAGATPVLADIDPLTLNIDPTEIARKISSRTKALVPVHFAGRPCEMDAIVQLANQHQLKIIEDCAHAIETEYRGQKAGTFGDFGCFSFYVTKNITTGEGGMVIGKKIEDIQRVKILALHGMSKDAWKRFSDDGYKHYQVVECGFKYNMMDLQAAIGIPQLARVDQSWIIRQQIWQQYQQAFADLPVQLPLEPQADTRHGYHLYTLILDPERSPLSRDQLLDAMTKRGIGVGVHYISLPEHSFYQQKFAWQPQQCPHAMFAGRQIISLPISAKLTAIELQRVISAVQELLQG
jgi:dTDP-4-amino-4,6-dideoxygalactose transaminase